MAQGITHEDWIYMIEMQMKHENEEAAKITVAAMKRDRALQEESEKLFTRLEKNTRDARYQPNYFKP